MSEWTRTAEDHPVSLWELLEEERMIAHKLACSCDRHIFFCQFLRRVQDTWRTRHDVFKVEMVNIANEARVPIECEVFGT